MSESPHDATPGDPPPYPPPPQSGYGPPPQSGYLPPPQSGYGPPAGAPQFGTGRLSPSDEKLWAMLSHLSFFVLGIVAPLIIMLTQGEKSPYVRRQAVEALNFHISVAIAGVVSFVLLFVLVGFVLLPLVAIGSVVLTIMAAIAANQGRDYRYPVSLRLVK